jgi:ABC-type nitrate/sulfonate/bicarbonate transport system substrate-binding protein
MNDSSKPKRADFDSCTSQENSRPLPCRTRREFIRGAAGAGVALAGSTLTAWADHHGHPTPNSLTACDTLPLSAENSSTQKIHVLTLLGRPLAVVVADSHGFFAKYGVEVTTENLPNSDVLRVNLAVGKGDIAYLAVDNAVAMVELVGADVVILMGGEGSQNELIAQPGIKSVKDFQGKTLIVDAPNTAYALQLKKILLLSGLQVGRDYEMKPVGATPQRLIAMHENKDYAGSMLGPPTSVLAKRGGFVSLGTVQNLIGPYQAAGYFTLRKWAQEHRDALTNYLAACIEAQRWLMAPANKQAVIELLIKESHLAPDVAAETYESYMTRPGGFAKDARLDLDGFKNVLKLRAEVEGQWGGKPPAPEKYYDQAYYLSALELLKGKK